MRPRGRLLLVAIAGGAIVALVLVRSLGGSSGSPGDQPSSTAATQLKVVAQLAHRPLGAPISSEVVVPSQGKLFLIGGLDAAGASANGVFTLDPSSGSLQPAGTLAAPLHDAAGAALGNRILVFGGGSSVSTDSVEALAGGRDAQTIGRLPSPRSDLAAATVGGHAYVLGGYDGTSPTPSVLQTSDGRSFSTVASLPTPVRYPAIAVSGGAIYAFGGETAIGQPTDVIQEFDPAAGTARIVGHLPQPLDHASAVAMGDRIYVLGGTASGKATDRILSFDPATATATPAGQLPMPVTNAAAATLGGSGYLVGGLGANGSPLASVVRVRLKQIPATPGAAQAPANTTSSTSTTTSTTSTTSTSSTSTTTAADTTKTPFSGRLLIADRGNDRLLLVNSRKRVLWRYPGPGRPPPPGGFYFPDDAFFTHGGTGIIANEEQNERIVQIGFPSGKVTWSYGHVGVAGSSPGYLREPDDSYLLKDGTVTVADAQNCRILLISPKRHVRQIGTSGSCVHNPPQSLGSPNGDTPLSNGDLLVSEVNGSYIDEFTPTGHLVWTVHLPIAYPSDPQQLGPDRYLVADYTSPGGIYEFNRAGHILWSYHPTSGAGMLDHPSLAERLPNGLIATNDDYRDRVVVINPLTKRIVWQYGHTDSPGTGPNRLNTPDGFDLLAPGGVTPTHPYTG